MEKGRRNRQDWRKRLRRTEKNAVCIPKVGKGLRESHPLTSGRLAQPVGVRERLCLVRRRKEL